MPAVITIAPQSHVSIASSIIHVTLASATSHTPVPCQHTTLQQPTMQRCHSTQHQPPPLPPVDNQDDDSNASPDRDHA